MKVEITEQEFNIRKSKGAIWICRSCKDNLNKIMMLRHDTALRPSVNYHFCDDCIMSIKVCSTCKAKKL